MHKDEELLNNNGFDVSQKTLHHWHVYGGNEEASYWPTKQKWMLHKSKTSGQGLRSLINKLSSS